MQVTVKLFANFRVGRFSVATPEYAEGTTVGDVIRQLRISESEIGVLLLNGRSVNLDEKLLDGANVSVFPLVGGG